MNDPLKSVFPEALGESAQSVLSDFSRRRNELLREKGKKHVTVKLGHGVAAATLLADARVFLAKFCIAIRDLFPGDGSVLVGVWHGVKMALSVEKSEIFLGTTSGTRREGVFDRFLSGGGGGS